MIKKIKKLLYKKFTKNYWQSSMSSSWHNKRKDEAYSDFESFAQAVSDKIGGLHYDTVIEVGTGAGTLITLLSERLNSYNKFIGIDINKQQITENQKNYKNLNNVEFLYMDIEKYIQEHHLNNVVVVSQNTLDYFRKKELEKLLQAIYNNIENVAIVVSMLKSNINLQDSVDRDEADFKVYHHNYYSLLQSAGYELMSVDPFGDGEDVVIISGYKQG